MLDWNRLPSIFRADVVKSLDLRSRCRLRHVAKSVLEFVDSVPLFIQRVRLHEKDGNVMLHFYTDVRKSMSVELASGVRSEVYCILRLDASQNKPSFAKPVGSTSPILAAVAIFKSVAMHPNTVLGGLELFFRAPELTASIDKLLGEHTTIRARLLKYDYKLGVDSAFLKRLVERDIREIQFVAEQPSSTYAIVEHFCYKRAPKASELVKRMVGAFVDTRRTSDGTGDTNCIASQHFCYSREKVTDPRAAVMKYVKNRKIDRNAPGDFSALFEPTASGDCGIMVRAHEKCGLMFYTQNNSVKEDKSNFVTCPMRYACPTHSDPFDYWYHMKRVADEYTYFDEPEFYDEEQLVGNFNNMNNVKRKFAELMKIAEQEEQQKGKKSPRNAEQKPKEQSCFDDELRRGVQKLLCGLVDAKRAQMNRELTREEIREAKKSIIWEKRAEFDALISAAEHRRRTRRPTEVLTEHEIGRLWLRFSMIDLFVMINHEGLEEHVDHIKAISDSDWRRLELSMAADMLKVMLTVGPRLTPSDRTQICIDFLNRNHERIQEMVERS